jgi:hypothetical protein
LRKDILPRIPAGIETNSLARLFYWLKTEERRHKYGRHMRKNSGEVKENEQGNNFIVRAIK